MSKYIYILGVPNFANYESSSALIRIPKDGGEIDYVSIGEDRLTRTKHTYMFPLRGIDYCLKHFGLSSLEQVDYMATDYARMPRWLNSGPGYQKLEHDYLKVMLKFPRERILIFDHHDAHAASCYYPSGFDEAGVLIVDGMGSELNTQTAYHFDGNDVTWVERAYDWGIGRAYSFVTGAILPYGPEKGYGKVMGLASYGADMEPSGVPLAGKREGMSTDYSHLMTRFPISRMNMSGIPHCTERQKVMQPPFPRIAFEIQEECERQMIEMARYIHEKTGTKRLCIAGGVGLNGRANYLIERDTPIETVWIQPACSDTGIPFGLALWAWFQNLAAEHPASSCHVSMQNAYCGSPYSASAIDKTLSRYNIEHRPTNAKEIAKLLADKKIVALFEGESEHGPRALGHRSIMADPRDRAMFDFLNSSVKFREPYRPYAPAVLEDRVSEYFEHSGRAPFMLRVADVVKDKYDVIPAVTHIDGTARIQTVNAEDNGLYYEIIKEFDAITGVPVMLNTSFNVNREPIVETPIDALICALSTSIDYLVIDGRLIACESYRRPELVNQFREDRGRGLDAEYEHLKEKHLYRYDDEEMQVYIEQENLIAEWHRRYRAKYELEKAMDGWRKHDQSILIVGTRNHTKCLYLYIPEFPTVSVTGFVAYDELPGEKGDFAGVYPELNLADVDWDKVSAVLISSHEYQRQMEQDILKVAPSDMPIVTLYDSACDSLVFTLPGNWPVMNPGEAARHNLELVAARQRTASNIDFDSEPSKIEITDRYAIGINYHWMRPSSIDAGYGIRSYETAERFTQQVARLSENLTFCRAKDLVDENCHLPESNIVLTFDDGAKDVIRYAEPVLKRFNIPATVFVCSQPYREKSVLDAHKIELLMTKLGLETFKKQFYVEVERRHSKEIPRESLGYAGDYEFYRYDNDEVRQFKLDLNYTMPYTVVTPVLTTLFEAAFGADSEAAAVKELYMSLDDLRKLVDNGWELGIHTQHHRVLPRLDFEAQYREIDQGFDFLSEITGDKSFSVAYPYGFADQQTKRAMKTAGMAAGFTMGRALITPDEIQKRWTIPRYDVNDCFDKKTNEICYDVFSSLSTGD